MTTTIERRAFEAAENAVGRIMTVRFSKNSSYRGEILEAQLIGWRERRCSYIAKFRVVLSNTWSDNPTRREFCVNKLPA